MCLTVKKQISVFCSCCRCSAWLQVRRKSKTQRLRRKLYWSSSTRLYRSTGTAARIEIKIERPNKVRTMQMRSWSQGEDKALVVIDAPARDAGTATLRVGNNLWNYLPKISRTIRVPPALMMGAWMGSDLTNDDLVRESSYAHDYEITGVGPSEEPPGWQVNSEAKPGVPGLWERVEVVFAPPKLATDSTRTGQLPILVRYYDRKGRLSRTMQLDEIKKMGGG